jgi:hypothetical protein
MNPWGVGSIPPTCKPSKEEPTAYARVSGLNYINAALK